MSHESLDYGTPYAPYRQIKGKINVENKTCFELSTYLCYDNKEKTHIIINNNVLKI